MGLALTLCSLSAPVCTAEEEGPEEKTIIAAKPDDGPQYRRLIERMLKDSPEGHKVKLTIVSVLDTNYGDRHIERLKCAVPVDPEGRPDGVEEHYRSLHYGHLEGSIPYKLGVREGIEKVYADKDDRGGRYVFSEIPWKNGKKHGVVKTYHPNGNVSSEMDYANGEANGNMRSLSIDGKLLREGTMKDDKRQGLVTEYWDKTGNPKREIPCDKGLVTGVVKEFYANGELKRELTFRDDVMHGTEKQYEADGKLSRTRYCFDGEVVSKDEFKERSRK